ncbi:MAG: DUF1295 domain-containing protein [Dehalococcoidales bacterium]
MADITPNLKKSFALYFLVYIIALFLAITVGYISRNLNPIIIVLAADIGSTLVVYGMGLVFRNASFYDAYWSVAPPAIALFWLLNTLHKGNLTVKQIIVLLLVFAWGLRLTYNWARQWQGIKHEDWRYHELRTKNPRWFWLIELVGVELMPTLIVFLACLSLYPAFSAGSKTFGVLDVLAIIVTAGAIIIETTADAQLRNFTKKSPQSGNTMTRGLWAYSRHPNYFGEIMFWWGIFFFGLAADFHYWWTIIGPVSVTLLFTVISIPLMEKRNLERRPDYAKVRESIPVLIPWFPKMR